jgi:hypothetical protein
MIFQKPILFWQNIYTSIQSIILTLNIICHLVKLPYFFNGLKSLLRNAQMQYSSLITHLQLVNRLHLIILKQHLVKIYYATNNKKSKYNSI